jgi:hypothetical protein
MASVPGVAKRGNREWGAGERLYVEVDDFALPDFDPLRGEQIERFIIRKAFGLLIRDAVNQ